MLGGNVSKTSFLGHPKLSLTPGACSQIQDLISSLTLSYTTGSAQQLSGTTSAWARIHLLKTPATVYLKIIRACYCQTGTYVPTPTHPPVWPCLGNILVYLLFSLNIREVPLSPLQGLPVGVSLDPVHRFDLGKHQFMFLYIHYDFMVCFRGQYISYLLCYGVPL